MRRVAVAVDLDWPYRHHQETVFGILSVGRERGWSCVLDPMPGGPGRAGRPDGLVGRLSAVQARRARWAGIPAVNVWMNSSDRLLPRVTADYAAAGRLAARHLLERGFRRFVYAGPEDDAAARAERAGFRASLGRRSCEILRTPRAGRTLGRVLERAVRRWVKPVGVLCLDDVLARHLAEACLAAGLRIPEDVALVGTGNTSLVSDLLEPPLSSVDLGFERVGRAAAELLGRLMDGRRPPRMPVRIAPSGVVARRSTDAFAVDDPLVASAMRVIRDRSRGPLKVAALLREVPASRRSLERRFRAVLGRTIRQEIERSRVERARRALSETDEPLKSVATAAGFRDASHLSRVFREREGVTPLEYRLRHGT